MGKENEIIKSYAKRTIQAQRELDKYGINIDDDWYLTAKKYRLENTTGEGDFGYTRKGIEILRQKIIQDIEEYASGDGDIDGSEDLSGDGVRDIKEIINKRFDFEDDN